jgi:hypothetical protein
MAAGATGLGKIYQVRAPDASGADVERANLLRFPARDGSYYLGADDLALARASGIAIRVESEIDEHELPVRFVLPHDGAVNDPPPESARLAVLSRLLAEERATGEVQIRFLGRHRSVPPDGFILDRAGGIRRYVWQVIPGDEAGARPPVAERFRALRDHLADPRRRVVLSLGSGGVKLFAHAAALRLLESLVSAEHVDEVWGSSAGALVALLYCHGLSPHAIEQTGYDLYSGRYDLALRPSTFRMLRELLRDAILPADGSASAGFVDCAKGLERMLAQYCDSIRLVRPFYCPAFNLARNRTDVLTPGPVPEHLADFVFRADPTDAALASASVPLLFVPRNVSVAGETMPYIDGSTTEGVPLYSVVRKWDRDREAGVESRDRLTIFYVKLTGVEEQGLGPGGRMSKLRLLQKIASAGVETMYARDLELIRQRPDIRLLPLELLDSAPDFLEISRIPEFIRLAKECFPEQLDRHEAALRQDRQEPIAIGR